jgi:hypothetical protein
VINQTLQHGLDRSALADCLLIFAARERALRETREKLTADIGRAEALPPFSDGCRCPTWAKKSAVTGSASRGREAVKTIGGK